MVTTRSADGPDSVLVVYARVQGIESIEASLSVDAGASFPTHNTFINDVLQRTFLPWAVADAAGDFHVVWEVELNNSGTGIIQHDILDGVTLADSANNTTVTTIQITDFANGTSEIPPQPDRGIFSVATVDVDRATGRLYLSYTDRPNNQSDDTDIYVRFSDNSGADWSDRIQINDDDTTTSQFMPRLVVDQTTGVIAAIWYDARDDVVNNGLVDIFTSVSHDSAASWSGNQRVTTARSNESVSNPFRDPRNYLEYIGFSVHAGVGYVSWTDARDDNFRSGTNEDIYSAVIYLSSTADPLEFSAFRGIYVSGDLDSLLESDGDKLCYNPGVVLMPTEAPITLDFVGTLPNDAPATLDVTIESTANTVGLGLTISFWNFNTNSWDVVGTAAQSLNDDVARTFAGTPADHVEPGTGEVRTRYEVRQEGPVFLFPWLDCVDHIFWTFS